MNAQAYSELHPFTSNLREIPMHVKRGVHFFLLNIVMWGILHDQLSSFCVFLE